MWIVLRELAAAISDQKSVQWFISYLNLHFGILICKLGLK